MTWSLFVIVCTLATVTAFGNYSDPFSVPETESTGEKFTKYANVLLAYKQYVPADLVVELEGITEPDNSAEVDELLVCVTLVKMQPEFEITDFIFFKEQCPNAYTRMSRLFASTVLRFMSLTDKAQSFITEHSQTSGSKTIADHVRHIALLKKQFDKLPLNVQAEYEVQFPEIMKLFSTTAYQTFINTLVELSDKSDEEITKGFTEAVKRIVTDFVMN